MVKAIFNTHVHKWGEKMFKQQKGGQIGPKASGTVAKCAMDDWLKRYEKLLKSLGFKVHLMVKYVDVMVSTTSNCQLDTIYRNGRLTQTEDDCFADMQEGKTRSHIMLDVLIEAANSLMKYLKFTGEASVNGS